MQQPPFSLEPSTQIFTEPSPQREDEELMKRFTSGTWQEVLDQPIK